MEININLTSHKACGMISMTPRLWSTLLQKAANKLSPYPTLTPTSTWKVARSSLTKQTPRISRLLVTSRPNSVWASRLQEILLWSTPMGMCWLMMEYLLTAMKCHLMDLVHKNSHSGNWDMLKRALTSGLSMVISSMNLPLSIKSTTYLRLTFSKEQILRIQISLAS